MEEDDVIRSLAALAQPVRLRVFRALVVAGPEGLTPGVLTEALMVPATSLSFHLKELTHAGLVTQERQGRHLVYRAQFNHMQCLLIIALRRRPLRRSNENILAQRRFQTPQIPPTLMQKSQWNLPFQQLH